MKFSFASRKLGSIFSVLTLACILFALPTESFAKGNPCKEKKRNMRQACTGKNVKPSKCTKKTNAYNACLAKAAKGPTRGKPGRPTKPSGPSKERPGRGPRY